MTIHLTAFGGLVAGFFGFPLLFLAVMGFVSLGEKK